MAGNLLPSASLGYTSGGVSWRKKLHAFSLSLALVLVVAAVTCQQRTGLSFEIEVEEKMGTSPESNGLTLPEVIEDGPVCWPCRVLEQYKREHSTLALERDSVNRKFALVYYWCPHRAGNLLHNFLNSLTWAIITNRTLLWAYESKGNNDVDDCQSVLERADWLPSWEEWSEKLNLPEPTPLVMAESRWKYDAQLETVFFPQIPDILQDEQLVRCDWHDHPLQKREHMMYINAMDRNFRERAGMLYYDGVEYLFGMLFRDVFTIQDDAIEAEPEPMFSAALHSRHTVAGDDGSFIVDEVACLRDILPDSRSLETCRVYLMSDRPRTVTKLTDWLVEHNCSAATAPHDSGASLSVEHGPWAGAGFIQDIALASRARSATIGDTQRSSFMLLKEIIEYDRTLDTESMSELRHCQLPPRNPGGYDYGPGTPTFRHRDFLDPLVPLQVLQAYRQIHSAHEDVGRPEAQEDSQGGGRYLVAIGVCRGELQETLHVAANHLLAAILTNRTLVWQDTACHGASVLPWVTTWQGAEPKAVRVTFKNMANLGDPVIMLEGEELTRPQEGIEWSETNTDMCEQLWSLTTPFLYGMLIEALFEFDKHPVVPRPSEVSSVALVVQEQANVVRSQKCLRKLLGANPPHDSCVVYLALETNPETTKALQHWLGQQEYDGCVVTISGTRTPLETGLWAATSARWAFVGDSYSEWVWQLIEYQRRVEIWRLGRLPPVVPVLEVCFVDDP